MITAGLYQVLKLRNTAATTATTTSTTTTTTTTTTTITTTWAHRRDPGGGPRENPKSLSSPKAEKELQHKTWKTINIHLRVSKWPCLKAI